MSSTTTKPSLTVTSPASGATVELGNITVSGTAADNSGTGLKQVLVKIDNTGNYTKATGTTNWSVTKTLTETGSHTVIAKASDNAGNYRAIHVPIIVVEQPNITLNASDGRAGIQNAIDNLEASGGGVILLNDGTYNLDTSIKLGSNITIRGQSPTGTILKRTSGTSGAFVVKNLGNPPGEAIGAGITNAVVENMSIDLQQPPNNRTGQSIIAFNDCTDVTVRNCDIKNCDATGIMIRRCDGVTIDNNTINFTWTPISSQSSRNVDIINNKTHFSLGDSIYVTQDFYKKVTHGSEDVLVRGNTIEEWCDTAIDSSISGGDDAYRNRRIWIEGNTINVSLVDARAIENNEIGITLSRTIDTHVIGNTIQDLGNNCINVGVNVSQSVAGEKLKIHNNTMRMFRTYSMRMQANVDFYNNTVNGSQATQACLEIGASGTQNSLIRGNRLNSGSHYGIYWNGDAQGITIDGNTITNPLDKGIFDNNKWTGSNSSIVVTNNTIQDTKSTHTMQYGIHKQRTGTVWNVSGNTITGYTIADVLLQQ